MRHRIMLNGFGYIGRVIRSSCDVYSTPLIENTKNASSQAINLSDLVKIQEPFVSLVDCYKKVKSKYYPEKDIIIKNNK